MAWILFKETLLVPYFYMQKLLLRKHLDNVSVTVKRKSKVKQVQKMEK